MKVPRQKKNLDGEIFGHLAVLKHLVEVKRNSPVWLCRCTCGNTTEVLSYNLTSGKTRSCGCSRLAKGPEHFNWKGFGQISGNFWSSIRKHAKDRNLSFQITKEEAMSAYQNQNGRCALSGELLTLPTGDSLTDRTASLDRINSSEGYNAGNIQWVHKKINMAKGRMSDEEFINMCKSVASWAEREQ